MLSQLKVRLIQRLKVPNDGNALTNFARSISAILLLLPLIALTCLVFIAMLPVIAIQKLTGSRSVKMNEADPVTEHWIPLLQMDGMLIEKFFQGEVRFGPAYYKLRSTPVIPGLSERVFGDWAHRSSNGILLQQWNSTAVANTELIYLDLRNGTLSTVLKELDSVDWSIGDQDHHNLILTCNNGKEKVIYQINEPALSS